VKVVVVEVAEVDMVLLLLLVDMVLLLHMVDILDILNHGHSLNNMACMVPHNMVTRQCILGILQREETQQQHTQVHHQHLLHLVHLLQLVLKQHQDTLHRLELLQIHMQPCKPTLDMLSLHTPHTQHTLLHQHMALDMVVEVEELLVGTQPSYLSGACPSVYPTRSWLPSSHHSGS